MVELTCPQLKEIVKYDPETGVFVWIKTGPRRVVGAPAGSLTTNGYASIMINYKNYLAHRLVWLYMTGDWPLQIDHINRNRSDNRYDNLRECTRSQNMRNARIPSHNSSGFKGVSWLKSKNKWRSYITVKRKYIHIGYYDDPVIAAKAYDEKAKELFGAFACTNSELGAGTIEQYIEHAKEFV